ncbi:MAG: putative phage abortive infection protein [Flavobacteriales bacterium]|nr:putative phage abortive infection protein [Flavobacteriales bacterium]
MILLIVFIIICAFPYFFSKRHSGVEFDATSGQIGDTIGGIMGPFIAMVVAALTFRAFYIQKLANDQVKEQFRKQSIETKFYEMLRLHRQNLEEFEIRSPDKSQFWKSKRCVVYMFEELRLVFNTVTYSIDQLKNVQGVHSSLLDNQAFISDFAYRIFFFGKHDFEARNPKFSERFIDFDQATYDKFKSEVFQSIKSIQEMYDENLIPQNARPTESFTLPASLIPVEDGETKYRVLVPEETVTLSKSGIDNYGVVVIDIGGGRLSGFPSPPERYHGKYELYYYPFDGHVVRLGHTYRHLYQTVKYLIEQERKEFLTKEEVLEYLRTLRGQLTNYDQLLLYYNGLSLGRNWFRYKHFY